MVARRGPTRAAGPPRCSWRASAVLVLALLAACSPSTARQQAPTPTPLPPQPAVEKPTYTVARGDIVEELQLSGRISAVRQDDLAFSQAGNVATIHVRATDVVTKGRLLAELNQGDLLNQLEQAELALQQVKLAIERDQRRRQFSIRRAELDLEEARARLRVAETATEREFAQFAVRRAELDLEEARTASDEDLDTQLAQRQLEYESVQGRVDAGRLFAPYGGEIASVGLAVGDPVEAYQPVITIMDPGETELRVENAVGADLLRLSPQQPVTIRFSRYPDTPLEGVIARLPQSATSAQSTVQADSAIRIDFEPGDLELDIGDLARVAVTLERKDGVLWLPPQAVRDFQGRRFVVVQNGDRQRRVDVKIGIANSDRVEIVEGLDEGQVVIGQ